jgi:hypothetical protein
LGVQTLYRDPFSYEEGRFKKEDGTLSKVKESDFEIVSIEKKKVNMHQSYLI